MSDHSFNPFIAKKYGVLEAIIISSLIFWTRTNASKESNYHLERFWCFGTPEYFSKYFPYLTPRQIKYTLAKLIKSQAVLKGNFNKKGYDKTNWYSLSDSLLIELNLDRTCLQPWTGLIEQNCPMDGTKLSDGQNKIVQPIPDTKPVTKTKIKPILASASPKYKASDYEKDVRFMRFYKAYPVRKKGAHAYKMWLRLNPDDDMLEMMFNDIQKRLTQDSQWIDGFIPHPATYLNPECPVFKDDIVDRNKMAHEAKQHKQALQQEASKKAEEERALASQRAADIERENNRLKRSDAGTFKNIQKVGHTRIADRLKDYNKNAMAAK